MKELLYQQIYNDLKEKITGGAVLPEERLPGIRELASGNNTSSKTVSRALAELEADGYIRRTQGQGIFVREKKAWRKDDVDELIGLIVSDMSRPYDMRLSAAIERRASERGYGLLIRSCAGMGCNREAAADMVKNGVRGIIIIADSAAVHDAEKWPSDVPVILTGVFDPPRGIKSHCIVVDSYHGFYSAACMLAEMGHRDIAWLGATDSPEDEAGYAACRDVLEGRRRGDYSSIAVSAGGYNAGCGAEAMKALLMNDFTPSAIICANDSIAAGAASACSEAGIRIPDDISIIGFGDQELAALMTPPLTTLRAPAETAGLLLVGLLDDLVRKRLSGEELLKIRLEMEIVDRGSVRSLGEDSGASWL